MKEAAVQTSGAGSAAANSPSNDARSMSECDPNAEKWGPAALEERRERTRDHLAIIAGRRETWIKRSRHHYGLLNRLLRFLMEPQKKVLSVRRLCQAKRTKLLDPVHGRTILRQTD